MLNYTDDFTLPRVLYRYTKRDWANQMMDKGTIRINTLEDLRKEERYGREIGDRGEGTLTTHMRGKPIDLTKPHTIPSAIRRMQDEKRMIGSGNIIVHGNVNETSANCYLYCLSLSRNLLNQFQEDTSGYDTVIEIFNPGKFILAITNSLNSKYSSINTCRSGLVEYRHRVQEFENESKTYPIFIKEPRHKWQEEFRLVWNSDGQRTEPILLSCPDLKYFSQIITK